MFCDFSKKGDDMLKSKEELKEELDNASKELDVALKEYHQIISTNKHPLDAKEVYEKFEETRREYGKAYDRYKMARGELTYNSYEATLKCSQKGQCTCGKEQPE